MGLCPTELLRGAVSGDRCGLCGHALSIHNELGYCRVNKMAGGKGQCGCDSGTKSALICICVEKDQCICEAGNSKLCKEWR